MSLKKNFPFFSFEQALASLCFGANTQTKTKPSKNAPAQRKIATLTTKQQRHSAPKARTAHVQKTTHTKPQPTVLRLKPAGARRSGISITRVVGGARTVGNSATKQVLAQGDLKNRIRVQSGSHTGFLESG